MFTLKVLKIIAKTINFLSYTKLFPFRWNQIDNTLSVTSSKISPVWTKIYVSHYIAYFAYNIYHLHGCLSKADHAFPVMDVVWLGIFASGYYLSFEGVLGPLVRKTEMVTLFRQMSNFDELVVKRKYTKM